MVQLSCKPLKRGKNNGKTDSLQMKLVIIYFKKMVQLSCKPLKRGKNNGKTDSLQMNCLLSAIYCTQIR